MSEGEEMTVAEFLNSLKRVSWFIKRKEKRYELRISEGLTNVIFTDKDGELFGIKNAKIDFYVFEKGTSKPAEWASEYLHDMYVEYDLRNKETEKELETTGYISWDLTLSYAFVLYLLKRENLLITDIDGVQEKIPPASRIY